MSTIIQYSCQDFYNCMYIDYRLLTRRLINVFIVTVKMKSKVALENTTETFSCSGYGEAILTIKNMNNSKQLVSWDQIPTDFPDYQINITGTVDQENIRTIDITIFTKANNNNTLFTCSFSFMAIDMTSATLYIAKGIKIEIILAY